jgi:hypothetical protein
MIGNAWRRVFTHALCDDLTKKLFAGVEVIPEAIQGRGRKCFHYIQP